MAGAHHHEYMLPNGDAHGHEKCATSAGLPLTKSESTDGRKKLPNGMLRVHRIMTEEELAQGKEPRWTELEIRGLFFLNLSSGFERKKKWHEFSKNIDFKRAKFTGQLKVHSWLCNI